jgi:anti-sigma regulatory factor (Ser/Thr protein kinase)
MKSKAQFPAKIHELHKALAWLRGHLEKAGLSKGEILRLELVLEEAFVNSVQHAYRNREGIIELEFKHIPNSSIEFSITDYGPPFNPLKEGPEVDVTKPIEDREVGGLGIYLMRHCVDDIRYLREAESNTLRFRKALHLRDGI